MIFFFSRQIGLSPAGDTIPLLAGSRITGRVGGWTIGALNIQQREKGASPSTNFTALRLRRNILANSDIGVMMVNKDPKGGDYNRGFGADANFRFLRDLTASVSVAKSASPKHRLAGSGDDWYSKSSAGYRSNRWEARGMYQTIGSRFNDEMGFVPRRGVDNSEFYLGARFRPRRMQRWLRETFPHIQFENFSRRNGGGLESRYMDWHWPVTFQNSTFVEIGTNPNIEVIDERFSINSRRRIFVNPGRYEFKEHFILVNTNSSAPFSMNLRAGTGEFYDGYRRNYTIGGTFRLNQHFNVSLSDQINDIELGSGSYVTHLLTGRFNVYFSTRMFVNALVQYNTDTHQWSSNVRLDIIHRPLSDIYLVYNERRDYRSGDLIARAIIAKMTYLFAF